MRAVALKELEARITEYVHLAEAGETVLVTEEDRVIAELVPPRDRRISPWESPALTEAVQKGWITPPVHANRGAPPRFPVAPLNEILRELDEDRSDR